jgi:ATP-dependent RNA helicase MSS116
MQIDAPVQILKHIMDSDPNHKIMAFFPTANLTSYYSQIFNFHLSRPVIEIHSRKPQAYRSSACNRFREKKTGITMFTSDVSARGIDFSGVSHVVQVGMPDSRETYIHRLGRTGRAGNDGKGLLILSDVEREFLSRDLKSLDIVEDGTILTDGHSCTDMENLRRIVGEGRNVSLAKAASSAYASMLGYYASKLKALGIRDKNDLVAFVNDFSVAAGLADPPSITPKVAESIGLRGVAGINISNKSRYNGNQKSAHGKSGKSRSKSGRGSNRGRGRWQRDGNRTEENSLGETADGEGAYDGWGNSKKW